LASGAGKEISTYVNSVRQGPSTEIRANGDKEERTYVKDVLQVIFYISVILQVIF